ncbi:hypothetical protein DL765_010851 [Monosporascus sp. GIB2]|nr:hypothetical protein DL765_010851 [Monosporascus sp. GIB2]
MSPTAQASRECVCGNHNPSLAMDLGDYSDYSHYRHVDDTEELIKGRSWTHSSALPDARIRPRQAQHGKFPRWSVLWRFFCTVLFSILVMAVLYSFSGIDSLTPWERRAFNTLTILLSSLVSLSLGSLLGLLGAAIRWVLLARKANTPRDVDLILGMPNPTGSLKLVFHHSGAHGKWSGTTLIVVLYLLVNIIGRLSVAAFGLTYDLDENAGIEYPVMINDFGTSEWIVGQGPSYSDQDLGRVSNYALTGLTSVPTEYNMSDPSTYTMTNISGLGLNRKVEGDTVTYSYSLREYRGLDQYPSTDKVLHSSSRCIGRAFYNGAVYEKGRRVGSTRDDGSDKPEFVRVLGAMYAWYSPATDYLWGMRWDYNNIDDPLACVTTYLNREIYPSHRNEYERNATFFECTTCLTDRNNNPGVGSDLFHGFPAGNVSYAAGVLLRFGPFDRIYQFEPSSPLSVKEYSSQEHTMHFINHIGALTYEKDGEDWFTHSVPAEYELHAAHLAARLPILAIIGAERQLPRVTRENGASERPYITTRVKVRWDRAIGVLAMILVGQLLAVVVVFFSCKGVFIRDHDSFLSVARLLRTAVNTIEGGSADSGKELANRIRAETGEGSVGGMRYGTRTKCNEDGRQQVEVDLWHDVDNIFLKKADYD